MVSFLVTIFADMEKNDLAVLLLAFAFLDLDIKSFDALAAELGALGQRSAHSGGLLPLSVQLRS